MSAGSAGCKFALRRFRLNEHGATAIEFAIVAPVFFLIVIGVLEIGLVGWFSSLLNDGANQASRYLRDQTMSCVRQGDNSALAVFLGVAGTECTAASIAGARQAACNVIARGGMGCDPNKLRLAIYPADNPAVTPIPSGNIIENNSPNLKSSRAYVVALGYEWPWALPTSKLILFNMNGRTQLQSRVFASTAERALR